MFKKKIILHLCADIGSDSRYYDLSNEYEVIKIGIEIGVENYLPPKNVYGIIANPVCTEFSTANHEREVDTEKGMFLVNHCLRIINECNPEFWVIENPATGTLRNEIGKPDAVISLGSTALRGLRELLFGESSICQGHCLQNGKTCQRIKICTLDLADQSHHLPFYTNLQFNLCQNTNI